MQAIDGIGCSLLFCTGETCLVIHREAVRAGTQAANCSPVLNAQILHIGTLRNGLAALLQLITICHRHISTCQVLDGRRSDVNPHGLLIEKFKVVKNDLVETRKR